MEKIPFNSSCIAAMALMLSGCVASTPELVSQDSFTLHDMPDVGIIINFESFSYYQDNSVSLIRYLSKNDELCVQYVSNAGVLVSYNSTSTNADIKTYCAEYVIDTSVSHFDSSTDLSKEYSFLNPVSIETIRSKGIAVQRVLTN
ncbi:hypothetical protein PVK63_13835 [Aliivibrio sp. S2TY2]|uniref:hypothetical protein n=1 Tax=unclassified Aliivibrio TaxID=2645654 RepID=UPI002378DB4A|nr:MULTISPECIES: hypothetical protein [unclassified Aliivibrio]MDD9176063.1 hypothetical protein [Aliivibrio sp. S3TY1]MDD9193023.1 hypothetical protein [Aliivibrio sp. S2TY2]